MNTTTQKQPFDLPAFKTKLFVTINTLMSYISDSDTDDWNAAFLPGTIKCFVTSEYFLNLSHNDRQNMVMQWQTVSYILELLGGLFTDEVRENTDLISKELRELLGYDKMKNHKTQ